MEYITIFGSCRQTPIKDYLQVSKIQDELNRKFVSNIITNLNRKIIFKEGKILQSLYKSASKLNIKPNIIVEFGGITFPAP